ncbi:MAG: hypothetical protein ACOY71_00810, partial [Gemmatimonadota bacterium]
FSASAGVLALTGAVATAVGVMLWRRRMRRTWYGVAAGVLLLLGAPYLVSSLGRGVTPPAEGVSPGLWLSWQLAVVLAVSAVMVLVAALFRGDGQVEGPMPVRRAAVAVVIAIIAATVGLYTWEPVGGWPEWYTFLWTPALILVALPAPRAATICGIALVAGSAASLVTWGTTIEGRIAVARRDVGRLGTEPDPLAVPLLERFAEQVVRDPHPARASDLFALWQASGLGLNPYPVRLGLWRADGTPITTLPLDSLEVSDSIVAGVVTGLRPEQHRTVVTQPGVPGVYHVLAARLGPDTVLSAVVGPRTQLIQASSLGRLLRPPRRAEPLYELELDQPSPGMGPGGGMVWRREGWRVRGEASLLFADGPRRLRATLDLRGPVPLIVRGALVVLLDVAMLGLLWLLAELAAGEPFRRPALGRARRSFRLRLAVSLAAFFVLPAVAFATWGFVRLGDETRHSRDLVIMQGLRDVAPAAGQLLSEMEDEIGLGLSHLADRAHAELALYSGGALVGTSA